LEAGLAHPIFDPVRGWLERIGDRVSLPLLNSFAQEQDLRTESGKPVRMEVYENGYHDFVMGPQGHAGRAEPLMDITLAALESTLDFLKDPAKHR
jgi:hypothetical protein